MPPGTDRPILLTTFNRNLAADLRARLLALAGPELAARVDIVNIDRLASRVVAEAGVGGNRRIMSERGRTRRVGVAAPGARRTRLGTADFLADEWAQVILGQVVDARIGLLPGPPPRPRPRLSRERTRPDLAARRAVHQRLTERGRWTWRQVAAAAARLETARAPAPSTATRTSSSTRRRT